MNPFKISLFTILLFITSVSYGINIEHLARDPFLLPATEHISDERYAYSVNELKLVALIHQGEKNLVQIMDPQKHFYTLQKGDSIGLEKAKITDIKDDGIIVKWMSRGQVFTDKLLE